jgi:hypothetical protein
VVAGIAFSLLLTSAIVTIRLAVLRDGFPRSGLLFIAMLFATGAVAGGLVAAADGGLRTADVWSFGRRVSYTLLTVYAMRMTAVFAISTTTIATRLGLAPRWLTALGLTTGLVLLLSAGLVPWLEPIFPLWVSSSASTSSW